MPLQGRTTCDYATSFFVCLVAWQIQSLCTVKRLVHFQLLDRYRQMIVRHLFCSSPLLLPLAHRREAVLTRNHCRPSGQSQSCRSNESTAGIRFQAQSDVRSTSETELNREMK